MTSRTEAASQLAGRGDGERDLLVGQCPLGADDALRDRGLGDQERPGYLVRGQAADQAQGQRGARLGGQHRVARDEDEAQQVVADVVIHLVDVGLAEGL
jgi:hypothetical protein